MHAFLWDKGSMRDLGVPGANNVDSIGTFINNAGDVIIQTGGPNQSQRQYLWQRGVVTYLAPLPGFGGDSWVNEMNSRGQIVGQAVDTFYVATPRAVLWDNRRPIVDLNAFVPPGSGIVLDEAMGINDLGEIVSTGVLPNGDHHVFLLIPVGE
jgi:uncharacterized membrane protein